MDTAVLQVLTNKYLLNHVFNMMEKEHSVLQLRLLSKDVRDRVDQVLALRWKQILTHTANGFTKALIHRCKEASPLHQLASIKKKFFSIDIVWQRGILTTAEQLNDLQERIEQESLQKIWQSVKMELLHVQDLPPLNASVDAINEFFVADTSTAILQSIRSLDLKDKQLKVVPSKILKRLTHLKELNLDNNFLVSVPNVNHCKKLTFLSIDNNFLLSFRTLRCKKIKYLYLKANLLTSCSPSHFKNCHNLKQIDLRENNLEKIPKFKYHPELLLLYDLSNSCCIFC